VFIAGLVMSYHVICGGSYYSTGLCIQPFYKNYSPLLRSTAPVSDGVELVQEIKPVCDGLTLVQVRINSSGAGGTGQTEFIVRDKSRDAALIDKVYQNDSLPDDDWLTLNLEPDWNSAGKSYELTIRGLGGQANEGPLFAYSQRPEYPAGSLYLNGAVQEDDLIFQYACITGLTKALQNIGR
jgi:hypothetical protein